MIYEYKNKLYEWDDDKAKINKIKHGISFKYAVRVFDDENRLTAADDEHSWEEERWQVLGKVDGIIFVVYTERGESTRIISARKATGYEEAEYYGGY